MGHDVSFPSAHGAANANLTRPLGYRDEHDIHNANAGGQQGNRTDKGDSQPHGHGKGVELGDEGIIGKDLEIIFFARRHLPQHAHDPAHLLDGILIAGLIPRLDQDVQTAPGWKAKPVHARGNGHHGEVVLVSTQRAAFGLQHTHHAVVDAVDLEAFAYRRAKREHIGCQTVAQHANVAAVVHIDIQHEPSLLESPIARRKTAGCLTK